MLGSDLIKAIVDKDLVDKEIIVIGESNDTSEIESEGSRINSIQLVEDQGVGLLVIDGSVEQ